MAKRRKHTAQDTPQPRTEKASTPPASPSAPALPAWLTKPWLGDVVAILAMYLVTFILFGAFLDDGVRFSAAGDGVAARAWNDVGAEIAEQVDGVAAWSPYPFMGYPIYGSLAYHAPSLLSPTDWMGEVGQWLFGGQGSAHQVFFYFLSGLLAYLFVRGVGLPWWASLLAGFTFLLNPYNISLAEAGHGSKQWTITMLPLIALLTHRLLTHRRILDMGLLALGTGALLLAMHAQVAYYGLLLSGSYALAWIIGQLIKKDTRVALSGTGLYAGGTVLGLMLSAFVYWPVYVFSKYSIRGVGPLRDSGGAAGLDWDYATAWSLHPLESLQFLVPGLFGLGGSQPADQYLRPETALDYNLYWGWMPFTQSSLYMGILPLLLAILAAVWLWKRRPVVRWMAVAGVVAWVVSFGKFLPVLYGPLYHALPFFNKFRVPSMALTVTALAVAVLGAYGLATLVRRVQAARSDDALRQRLSRLTMVVALIALVGLVLALVVDGPIGFTPIKQGEVGRYDDQTLSFLVALRGEIFVQTLLSTAMVLLAFAVAIRLSLQRGWGTLLPLAILVGVGATAAELAALDARFLHPVSASRFRSALAETDAARWLQQQRDVADEPFRIFPVSDFQSNTWMYHRIPTIGGYGANKLRVYQDLLDYGLLAGGQPNLALSGLMNARYLVAGGQLPASFTLAHADTVSRQFIYHNPYALPRAFFVDEVITMDDPDDAMTGIAAPDFDPARTAIVLGDGPFTNTPGDSARSVRVPANAYGPHEFVIETSATAPQFLVLSEIWYPQGWEARIDGEPIAIERVNYAFRGMQVPAGEHTITMTYDPPEIAAGFLVSRIALLVSLALVGLGAAMVWRRRAPAPDPTD